MLPRPSGKRGLPVMVSPVNIANVWFLYLVRSFSCKCSSKLRNHDGRQKQLQAAAVEIPTFGFLKGGGGGLGGRVLTTLATFVICLSHTSINILPTLSKRGNEETSFSKTRWITTVNITSNTSCHWQSLYLSFTSVSFLTMKAEMT